MGDGSKKNSHRSGCRDIVGPDAETLYHPRDRLQHKHHSHATSQPQGDSGLLWTLSPLLSRAEVLILSGSPLSWSVLARSGCGSGSGLGLGLGLGLRPYLDPTRKYFLARKIIGYMNSPSPGKPIRTRCCYKGSLWLPQFRWKLLLTRRAIFDAQHYLFCPPGTQMNACHTYC